MVVVGSQADEIRSAVRRPERAVFAENANYQLGSLSSMQCGLLTMRKQSRVFCSHWSIILMCSRPPSPHW